MTKDQVLRILRDHPDQFVSGGALASELHLTRTSVWKAVEQLREDGYEITSVPRMGHRLSSCSDVLSGEGILRHLTAKDVEVRYFPSITSTNTVLKQLAAEDAPAGLALVAGEQTAGRGRMGRSFYSPAGTGLYLSLLLRPALQAAEAVKLTACAAVSVAEAIESLADVRLDIKWVNDLYLGGRKVCGILTEAGLESETGRMSYVVIGIGINTRIPADDFPEDIRGVAGAVFGSAPVPDLRNRLAARVLDRLTVYAANPGDENLYQKYRARSLVLGQPIHILSPGQDPVPARALNLERDFSLRVRLADGSVQRLNSGEISVRL